MLKANSKPPKINIKYDRPNKIFILKKIAIFNIKTNNIMTINSLLKSNDIKLSALKIKLQKAKTNNIKKIDSQSNTPIN